MSVKLDAPRPGWKTTEFWVTMVSIAGVLALLAAGTISVEEAVKLVPLLAGAYALSRGIAKH